jgi:hypothetical protein
MDKIAKAIYDNIGSKLDHRSDDQRLEDYTNLVGLLEQHYPSFQWDSYMSESSVRYVLWRDCGKLEFPWLHWPNPCVVHIDELPDDMGPASYDSDKEYTLEEDGLEIIVNN